MSASYSIFIGFPSENTQAVYRKLVEILSTESARSLVQLDFWEPATEITAKLLMSHVWGSVKYGIKNTNGDSLSERQDLEILMPCPHSFSTYLDSLGFEINGIKYTSDKQSLIISGFDIGFSVGEKWGVIHFLSTLTTMSRQFVNQTEVHEFFVQQFSEYASLIVFDYECDTVTILYPKTQTQLTVENIRDYDICFEQNDIDSPDHLIELFLECYALELKMEFVCQEMPTLSLEKFVQRLETDLDILTISNHRDDKSLLDIAIESNRLDIAMYLIDKSVLIAHPKRGQQACYRALYGGHFDLFKYLISRGAYFDLDVFESKYVFCNLIEKSTQLLNSREVLKIFDFLLKETYCAEYLNPEAENKIYNWKRVKSHQQALAFLKEKDINMHLLQGIPEKLFSTLLEKYLSNWNKLNGYEQLYPSKKFYMDKYTDLFMVILEQANTLLWLLDFVFED